MVKQTQTSRKRGSYAPEATRQAILDASLALFSERGFHATTVQSITEKANLTKGAFYHHFVSKEHVLQQIHAEYATEMAEGALNVIGDKELSPIEQLRAIITQAVISLGRHRLHVAVFYQEFRFLDGEAYASIRQLHDKQESILLDVIKRAKKAGQLRKNIDPQLLVFAISGITAWIYTWYNPKGRRSLENIADHLADIILEGSTA